jgi:hypothetical protein
MLYYKHTQITEEIMSRIKPNEYKKIKLREARAKERSPHFVSCLQKYSLPNPKSNNLCEAYKARDCINGLAKHGFDLHDIAYHVHGYIALNDNDTHSKNRSFEKFLGGAGNGKAEPDCAWGEIKCSQVTELHKLEQVMTVGRIYKTNRKDKSRNIADRFEDSSVHKKLLVLLMASYLQEGKQLGRKLLPCFVFELNKGPYYAKIKEDWEYYRDEYHKREKLLAAGKIKKRASGIMKSDCKGKRCPNSTLGIRSDAIIFPASFYKEVSEHYDK